MKSSVASCNIYHEGVVRMSSDNSVIVSISSASACSGCHSEGNCTLSGKEEKIIEVNGCYEVKPGDNVTVIMKQSMGYAALFLGYIIPLISVVFALITLVMLKIPELIAGLASLAILVPYYMILYIFRKQVNEKFTFTLKV